MKWEGTYIICRTAQAGVFAGTLHSLRGQVAELTNARRLWAWEGAASLSELAQRGTSRPQACRFPCPVDWVLLFEVIECLQVTPEARATIDAVPIWSA